ncbi:DUF5719 family protein [Nocardioides sp. R-C-SC26]|uniref:DUF5719 family protein n=1 Tax=Nocardioides sp. R-C-SC26 TaxID=2870414 RepID=UPI001E3E3F1E|nr:DUF5719 family protein [Nocardioides sp. R-C-SC26]
MTEKTGRRAAVSDQTARRRIQAARAVDPLTAVMVVVPLLAVLAALGVRAAGGTSPSHGPQNVPLSRSVIICPPGATDLAVASMSGARGTIEVRTGGIDREAEVGPGITDSLSLGNKSAVLVGRGDLAPGLVAGRFGRPLSNIDCRPPDFDEWFTGVGAGAKHQSVLQLANPDGGRAIVDVVVLGRKGPVDVPALRGVAVRGGETREFDLAQLIPREDDLALRVRTLRGRIAASVLDTFAEIGNGQSGTDGLPPQSAPATRNLLMGLPGGAGKRVLVVANPGADAGRVSLRFVTRDATFAPEGADDIALPAGSVVRVPLAKFLKGAGTRDDERPLGLELVSTVPATAGLVMFVDGDLTHAVPTDPLTGAGSTPLPPGTKQLVLGGATKPGVVLVDAYDDAGKALPDQRIEIAAGRGVSVEVPAAARLITVTPQRTSVSAVVIVTGLGATLVRPREPIDTGLVPHVAPGRP